MPSPDKIPLSFDRDRAVRQLDARFEELLEKLRKNRPSEDPWMVRRAYEIASERHHDQLRSSGDPYLSHLLEVAHQDRPPQHHGARDAPGGNRPQNASGHGA